MSTTIDPQAFLSIPSLVDVGVQGDDVRRRMHGARTTFVRVFEVHVDAPVPARPPGLSAGEVRIIGRPASEAAATGAVRAAVALAEGAPLTGFSLADLYALAPDPDALAELCSRLHDAGLEAIADTPLDSTLLEDIPTAVRAARDAGLGVWRLTLHALPAGLSSELLPAQGSELMPAPRSELINAARIASVERARDLQAAVGGFRAFAPLPRTMSVATPTTGYDDVKQVALARMVVNNIDSIQVDWPLYGPKLAQVALTVGADDVDGIAAVDPGVLGTRRSPIEEIKGNIRAAALEAVERDGRFQLLG
jgi:aminodeoxyfutalosine synthase